MKGSHMRHWVEVADGLLRLTGRRGGYALLRDGACLLVDPPRADWARALRELGRHGADWILATHHHRDSLAGAAGLVASGARLLVPEAEVPLVAAAAEFWQRARTYVLYDCDSSFSALRDSIPVSRGVEPGQSLSLGPWRVQALPLRGHTRSHTGYVVEHAGRRIAFVGDAMAGGGSVHNWCDFHWDYMDFNRGHRALLEDLEALADARADLLCPAHAQPLEGVASELDALRANLKSFAELVEPNRLPRERQELRPLLPHVWFIGQTCYGIVAEDGAALLYDVGFPEPLRDRLSEFCRLAEVKRIEAITFSHYHDDHCWRATEAAYGYPGSSHDAPRAEIWSHRILASILAEPARFRYPCLIPDPMHIDRLLDDEPFDFHGIRMRSIFLPGQTYWHAGLIVDIDGRRVAFTGDNIWHPRSRDRPIMGPIMSRNRYLPGVNHSLAARRLLELGVDTIFPAHGEGFDVTRGDLEAYRDWADSVAGRVRALSSRDLSGIDCWWCRIDPFHLYAMPGRAYPLVVAVDSPFVEPVRIRATLNLPPGFSAVAAPRDSMEIQPGSSGSIEFLLSVPADWPADRRLPVTVDLLVNGELWPEQAEGLVIPRLA